MAQMASMRQPKRSKDIVGPPTLKHAMCRDASGLMTGSGMVVAMDSAFAETWTGKGAGASGKEGDGTLGKGKLGDCEVKLSRPKSGWGVGI